MSDDGKRNVVWALVGKLGAIATFLLTIIGIVTWLNNPTAKLYAEVDMGRFEIPPRYAEFATSMEELISADSIKAALKETLGEQKDNEKNSESIERISDVLARTLLLKSKIIERKSEIPYRYYWNVSVINTGELPVNDVRLRLPGSIVGLVKREDGKYSIDNDGPVVEIGQIAAGEEVVVAAWSDSYIGLDDPAIYHSAGSGTIKIKGKFYFWEFIGEYWFPILLVAILLISLIFLLAILIVSKAIKSVSEVTVTTSSTVNEQAVAARRKKRIDP